ncbi:hypothetical protein FM036_30760 [Nostoc sp. HG1]|nr:hypothetical protein [Nostoc sp. HG1]
MLNSYSDLLSYNEIRPLISIAIQLTWSYLIKFNDKSAPEKQEIEIFVKTSYRDEVIFSSLGMGEEYETENFELEDGYSNNPHFELGINYTARTWGVDMEALLSNRLESLRVLDNKPREWVRKYARSIGTCCGWIAFFLPLPHLFSKVSEYRETLIKNRQRELAQVIGEQTDIREKLDYVLNYVINGNYLRDEPSLVAVHQYASLFAVTFISSWIVGRLVVSIANDERSSFLVLTSKSAQYRERNLRKKRQNSNLFIISLLVSLLINIISSYIYSYLTK